MKQREISRKRQIIHFNFSSPWFLFNVVQAIKLRWVLQLNVDTTFSFYLDMIAPCYCSIMMDGAKNSACWSCIPCIFDAESIHHDGAREACLRGQPLRCTGRHPAAGSCLLLEVGARGLIQLIATAWQVSLKQKQTRQRRDVTFFKQNYEYFIKSFSCFISKFLSN
jgi:hypothetical protein